MTTVLYLLGFSFSCGLGYVGMRLILAARADALQQSIADERTAMEQIDAHRSLHEQTVRAIASESIAQAIADYEAHDLNAIQAITHRGTR